MTTTTVIFLNRDGQLGIAFVDGDVSPEAARDTVKAHNSGSQVHAVIEAECGANTITAYDDEGEELSRSYY